MRLLENLACMDRRCLLSSSSIMRTTSYLHEVFGFSQTRSAVPGLPRARAFDVLAQLFS